MCVCARAHAWGACVYVDAQERACAFVLVALLIEHAARIRHIVWGLAGSTAFFYIIS